MNITDLKTEYDRIVEILKGIADGSKQIDKNSGWGFSGNITIESEGYRIILFIDCDDLDYVDSVILPDGNKIDFFDFFENFDNDPLQGLSEIEICNLETIIQKGV